MMIKNSDLSVFRVSSLTQLLGPIEMSGSTRDQASLRQMITSVQAANMAAAR
jgi:hypothetical protein